MRYLALDLGERRIGLAVGDDESRLATSLRSIQRRGGDADIEAIRAVIRAEEVDALVIGLPLTMRGEEGPQATRTRAFGERIAASLGVPHEYIDERLTSRQAERYRGRGRFDVDSAAAAILLQHRLDRRERTGQDGSGATRTGAPAPASRGTTPTGAPAPNAAPGSHGRHDEGGRD
jgi:putative holliday junction resolvase